MLCIARLVKSLRIVKNKLDSLDLSDFRV
jgi:hypothetical protein